MEWRSGPTYAPSWPVNGPGPADGPCWRRIVASSADATASAPIPPTMYRRFRWRDPASDPLAPARARRAVRPLSAAARRTPGCALALAEAPYAAPRALLPGARAQPSRGPG